jgi:riboflavin biosynthesis pyrimidine reductase
VTSSGEIDITHPAIAAGATVVTTSRRAAALHGKLPARCDVIEVGESGRVDVNRVVGLLRERGYEVILSEGGPHLMADLVANDQLDEAFLTLSPVVAGRDGDERLGMLAGVELLPLRGVWTRLLSARRHGDFLFLRYRLR